MAVQPLKKDIETLKAKLTAWETALVRDPDRAVNIAQEIHAYLYNWDSNIGIHVKY